MKVKEVMNTHPITIGPEESAAVAARILSRGNIGFLPVCTAEGCLSGVVTDRDLVLRCVAAQKQPDETAVKTLMSSRLVSVDAEADIREAAQKLAKEQLRRLPVTQNGKLVGVVSVGDLLQTPEYRMEAADCMGAIVKNVRKG